MKTKARGGFHFHLHHPWLRHLHQLRQARVRDEQSQRAKEFKYVDD
jgi:hypothetical protein